jgi:starch synthase (maltosyl-transferring)
MAVLHDAVRAGKSAEILEQPGHRAYAVPAPATSGEWRQAAERALLLGFDTLLAVAGGPADPGAEAAGDLAAMASAAHASGLRATVLLGIGEAESTHPLVTTIAQGCFATPPPEQTDIADPRRPVRRAAATVRLRRNTHAGLLTWWHERLRRLRQAGLDGAVTLNPGRAGHALADALSTPAFPLQVLAGTVGAGSIVYVGPGGLPANIDVMAELALSATGWALHAGAGAEMDATIRAVNRILRDAQTQPIGVLRDWTGSGAPLRITSRAIGRTALVHVQNRSTLPASWPPAHLPPLPWQQFSPVQGFNAGFPAVAPGGMILLEASAEPAAAAPPLLTAQQAAAPSRRIAITRLTPSADAGAFAVKRVIGETLQVEADIFADGHEQLGAALLLRAEGETTWQSYRMSAQPNDVWTASARLTRLGQHNMVVQAWLDVWGGFTRDLARKCAAGQDVALEIREARALLAAAKKRAAPPHAASLAALIADIDAGSIADPVASLTAAPIAAAMHAADEQKFLTASFTQPIVVEREAARFSSWYELFPRSQSPVPGRHGTFTDAAEKLPHIAAMGFDTVYFPPIHPIGERNRKGPNNTVTAAPGDVGSPYAIGSRDGGHDAIHPELGTLEDFQALLASARAHGLEVALDFAIQCAPDHPWLAQHPGWFDWRPDGTIKYAENPPKKYQDIVNVDFYAEGAVPDLWLALRDVVLFWASQGVRSFRVDNPHTKPLPFWSWMIAAVKARYPDSLFLSEAFTRPKPMYQLAKAGFSQSYTYFTWRTGKAELIAYLIELTQTEIRDYFRPHFFVNTPDINPLFLQSAGRAGFLIRAALAATLSGLWGVYSGFELCEAAALPGREEYLDSEKYQLRQRPLRAPGDIVAEITALNRLRRAEPALQSHLGVEFHNVYNDNILYYSKSSPGQTSRILVSVSLDPYNPQEADIEVPLWLFGLQDWQSVATEDLLSGNRFTWTGKIQRIRLTPQSPYAIWRISPPGQA